jgi:hypothetical protein
MPSPLYDGPDRRRTVQDRFEEAVELASMRAAQRVAHIHRWRLVRWTFLAALVSALAAMLILWLVWIDPGERDFARKNAIYDCQLFRNNANIMADFVKTDASLRRREEALSKRAEILQGYQKIFGKKQLKDAIAASHKIDADAIKHWINVDVKQLESNGGIDCSKHLSNG